MGTAGDTDGDGYAEIIVGARGAARASVYGGFGGPLADAVRELAGDENEFGWSVASAGDVNGDGYSDVIVSDPGAEQVSVYLGSATGTIPTPDWIRMGIAWQFGWSVASAGDVNGDGYADVIVGSRVATAYVYHGSASGLGELAAWSSPGQAAPYRLTAAYAGDVNGDGYSDIITGTGTWGSSSQGRTRVFHGSASGLSDSPDWEIEGAISGLQLGASVSGAGDVNGDGFSDVIVGAPQRDGKGFAFVYLGSEDGVSASPDWFAEGDQDGGKFGAAVGTAGDVNGDGYSDVIVGDWAHESGIGQAIVYHGSATGLAAAPSWQSQGFENGGNFGDSVGTAGDVNGDGFSDVLIGAPSRIGQNEPRAAAFLYLGSAQGLSVDPHYSPQLAGEGDDEFGSSVATAGDVNGDGFSDVIVGASAFGEEGNAGDAYVYLGNEGAGLNRRSGQAQPDGTRPIPPLGRSDSSSSFLVKVCGRSPGGRDDVRLQVEVKPAGVPFDGAGLITGPAEDSGAAGGIAELTQLVTSLTPDTLYRWRLRVITTSPFFPRSPWFSIAGNAATEADLRTAPGPVSVAGQTSAVGAPKLAHPNPNPFRSVMEVTFTLGQAGPVRLAVYDVSGRQIAELADGTHVAGAHTARWDGHAAGGNRAAAGIYFLRLELDGRSEARKVVLVD